MIGAGSYGWGPKYDGHDPGNYDVVLLDSTHSPHKDNMLDLYHLGIELNTNVAIRGGNDKHHITISFFIKARSTSEKYIRTLFVLLKGSQGRSDWVRFQEREFYHI